MGFLLYHASMLADDEVSLFKHATVRPVDQQQDIRISAKA